LAEEFGSRLTLMHVLENYPDWDSRPAPIEEVTQRLAAAVPVGSALPYAPETVIERGSAWLSIVNAAAKRDADLIVLGAHPAVGTTHVPWSTVHRVVAKSSCPVLTVRT
jgi:nucleotide-binding universal stress UspA family protein